MNWLAQTAAMVGPLSDEFQTCSRMCSWMPAFSFMCRSGAAAKTRRHCQKKWAASATNLIYVPVATPHSLERSIPTNGWTLQLLGSGCCLQQQQHGQSPKPHGIMQNFNMKLLTSMIKTLHHYRRQPLCCRCPSPDHLLPSHFHLPLLP